MKLCLLGSGSRGNAVLMQSGDTRVLIDAGFGPRTIARRMLSIGVDPASIQAVIVTHEHSDHVAGVRAGAKRWGWQIYATAGTLSACASLTKAGAITLQPNTPIAIGDFEMNPVATSHDANEPVAIVATGRNTGARAAIVYDLGIITEAVQRAIANVEILVIESNHDGDMLRYGPYPAVLKRRIASNHGHLSNRAAGFAAIRNAHGGLSHVILAHLSEVNNTPQVATESMRRALARTSFKGTITAAPQDTPSRPVSAVKSAAFFAVQLDLGL